MPEIISGKYVTAARKEHKGKYGLLLKFGNPDSKVNTVPIEALKEIHQALDEVREDKSLTFIVFHGDQGKIHAGADLTMFAGDIDSQAVHDYLMAGTNLDLKIKEISLKKRTVSIMQGERYGGSAEWPLMAGYSVCTPETGIRFSEVNVGIIPGWDGILNVMLRSNKDNALYMAATGNRVDADEMLEFGLVTRIVPEDTIMDSALDLATADFVKPKGKHGTFASREELDKIIAARMDTGKYRKLAEEASRKMERGEPSDDIRKFVGKRLNEIGKPVAPPAVNAVFKLIDTYPKLERDDMDRIKEMAHDEAESCFRLMDTVDRRTGVNSILTNDPLQKIPIYSGK